MDITKNDLTDDRVVPLEISPSIVPWINIGTQSIVSVEHPYIVRDIDKGVASLGGQEKKLDKVY